MRKAIALIELIFAIVVIAITLLAVPNLLSLSKSTSDSAITQESISSAASQVALIMSQYWDEVDSDINYDSPILYVDNGDSELNEANDTNGNLLGRRVGSNKDTPRRFGVDINGNKLKASNTLGIDANDNNIKDDIDDFNGQVYNLVLHEPSSTEVGEFKDINISIATKINYISDKVNYAIQNITFNNPFKYSSSKSTNIKAISVTITSPNDSNKKIVLKAFSCNIGASKLREKSF